LKAFVELVTACGLDHEEVKVGVGGQTRDCDVQA
jgi:hypothetical protein